MTFCIFLHDFPSSSMRRGRDAPWTSVGARPAQPPAAWFCTKSPPRRVLGVLKKKERAAPLGRVLREGLSAWVRRPRGQSPYTGCVDVWEGRTHAERSRRMTRPVCMMASSRNGRLGKYRRLRPAWGDQEAHTYNLHRHNHSLRLLTVAELHTRTCMDCVQYVNPVLSTPPLSPHTYTTTPTHTHTRVHMCMACAMTHIRNIACARASVHQQHDVRVGRGWAAA